MCWQIPLIIEHWISSWCIFVYWVCCLWFGVYVKPLTMPDQRKSFQHLYQHITFSPPLFLSRFVYLTSNKGHFLFSNPIVCSLCGLRFCLRVWVFPCCVYMCKYAFGNSDCESQQWGHRFKFEKAGNVCHFHVCLRMAYDVYCIIYLTDCSGSVCWLVNIVFIVKQTFLNGCFDFKFWLDVDEMTPSL